jgi:hypothetical protein
MAEIRGHSSFWKERKYVEQSVPRERTDPILETSPVSFLL